MKALPLFLLTGFGILIQSCTEGPKEIAPNPEIDSVKITHEDSLAPKVVRIGRSDFAAIDLSAEDTKKALLEGSEWLWFGTFIGSTSDSATFELYKGSIEKLRDTYEPIGDSLYFSASDKYTHIINYEPGKRSFVGKEAYSFDKKDNQKILKGNFQVTDQHLLILNEEKGHEENEQFTISVLNKDLMFIEEGISFEGKSFVAYKRYIRTGETKK